MLPESEGITWIASYPKSGNTWVRCLLQAYRTNGFLDLNDLYTVAGDSAAAYTSAVSPIPLKELGQRGHWLVRPAALMMACMGKPVPRMFKTHFPNIALEGLPAFIPPELTARAIYILRDPRSVALSFSKFFSYSIPKTVECMANLKFWIGTEWDIQTAQFLSSWSNHVASWTGSQTKFPVHIIKYEELYEAPRKVLRDLLEFLGIEPEVDRIRRAVEAAELSRLQTVEQEQGFKEYTLKSERGTFFNEGGTRWQEELGARWARQIEEDHGEVMKLVEYL